MCAVRSSAIVLPKDTRGKGKRGGYLKGAFLGCVGKGIYFKSDAGVGWISVFFCSWMFFLDRSFWIQLWEDLVRSFRRGSFPVR